MDSKHNRDINRFWIAGINYKKTDASIRGHFAINEAQYARILSLSPAYGLKEFFILSTCNRTEIYGYADKVEHLVNAVCAETQGSIEDFNELAYIKNGWAAVQHLFEVSAGLDSQILGDYEILGQIKTAVKFSKAHGYVGALLERFANSVLQASKAIKTQTMLSSGTVSVSFAAIQYIKEHVQDVRDKKILLVGTGKIGRNTCKNLTDYLGANNITLINRTEEKATELANTLQLRVASYEHLQEEAASADIIIVATNAPQPTIQAGHVAQSKQQIIIDLSIPYNVAPEAGTMPNITLVNVDELSRIKDETLQMRSAEVPKAHKIIAEHIAELKEWYAMRRHVPMLQEVKVKLQELHTNNIQYTPVHHIDAGEKIQKVINTLATKMRRKNTIGCCYIEAINEFIA